MGAEGGLYLAGEDDDLVDRSSSLVLQELADDDTTKRAGPNDGEIFVPGHDRWLLLCVNECWEPPVLLFMLAWRLFESHQSH